MITLQDIGDVFILTILLFAFSGLLFLTAYLGTWLYSKRKSILGIDQIRKGIWVGMPLGFTGMAAGFLTGSSRAPAVAALVPAILTFVGLSVVYLIGRGTFRGILAGIMVLMFSFNLLFGTFLGSASRDRADQLSSSLAALKRNAEKEFAIRRYRSSFGLPPDPPRLTRPTTESDKP
jgi:hypothetical protein